KNYPELSELLILGDANAKLEIPETEENLEAVAFHSKLFADFRQDVAKGDIEGGTARFINRLTGNKDYAKDNGSYGLTSLRSRHVAVARSEFAFQLQGQERQDMAPAGEEP